MVGNNILVTGGAGYIGSHTVLQLLLGGYNTVVIDNLDNSSLNRVKDLAGYDGQYLTFHQVDLRDKPALDKVFSESKFDAVIHFAGQKAVGECVAEPLLYYTNNLIGTITLVEVMAAHGCKKLVFSSSATLSGSTEESPLSGMSFYGRTQLCIENICRDVQLCDPEWRIIMLRYFNPVGAQTDYTTKDGLDVRDYLQVVDLADGHICALQKLDDTEIGCELYNLRTVKGTTVLEMVDASEKASTMKIPRLGDPIEGDGVSEKSGIQCSNLRIEADDVSEKSEGGALHKLSAYLVKQTELELIYGGRLMRCGRLMRSDYFPGEFTEKVVDILESRVLFLERHGTEVMKEKLLEAKKLISDAKDYLKKAKKKLKEEQEMN